MSSGSQISQLTSASSISPSDFIPIVTDTSGTPLTQKVSVEVLLAGSGSASASSISASVVETNIINLNEISTPSTPSGSQVSLYAKDGGQLFVKDDLGIEKLVVGYSNGWIPVSVMPAYVSATSIRFTGVNLSSVFPVGTKIKLKQTTDKYFYVIGAAYSGGNTTLTLTGGSDFSVANATITEFWYSHELAYGFPEWFNYVPTITVGGSMTISSISIDLANFSIINGTCFVNVSSTFTLGGTASMDLIISLELNSADSRIVMAGQAIMGSSTAQYGANVLKLSSNTVVVRPSDTSNWSLGTSRSARISGFYRL
jgi:hypothetical protein